MPVMVKPGGVRHLVREVHSDRRAVQIMKQAFAPCGGFCPATPHPDHFSGLRSISRRARAPVLRPGPQTAEIIAIQSKFLPALNATPTRRPTCWWRRGRAAGCGTRLEQAFFLRFLNIIFMASTRPDPDEIIPENSDLRDQREKWNVFPSPGHASDLYRSNNREQGWCVLFTGDQRAALEQPPGSGPPNSDLEAYIASESERMLEAPEARPVLAAHGSPVYDPKKRIRDIIVSAAANRTVCGIRGPQRRGCNGRRDNPKAVCG